MTHNWDKQALVAKVMDNPRKCALKFEAALQIFLDHDDVKRKYLKLGEEPNISNPMLEYILDGAIGESKYKEGEVMTHLGKAYNTAKE